MTTFHIAIEKPEEIIPRLGKQELHWKKGRSAYELSHAWMNSQGFPARVAEVLAQAPEWQDAQFLEGIFERETELDGHGYPSQTDLMCIVLLQAATAILGIEGKVDEPFGPKVLEWLSKDTAGNKANRLAGLCRTLGITSSAAESLHYQLLHRTCASIYEARKFGFRHGAMIVHSFSPIHACFQEFRAFSEVVGLAVDAPGKISQTRTLGGVEMRIGWAADVPSP